MPRPQFWPQEKPHVWWVSAQAADEVHQRPAKQLPERNLTGLSGQAWGVPGEIDLAAVSTRWGAAVANAIPLGDPFRRRLKKAAKLTQSGEWLGRLALPYAR
jgi:hypothetical protein